MVDLVLAILLFCCLWGSIALVVVVVRFSRSQFAHDLTGFASIVSFLWALFFYLMRIL